MSSPARPPATGRIRTLPPAPTLLPTDKLVAGRRIGAGRPVGEAARRRIWLLLCCFGFALLAFTTRPGHLISDTKMDLALNPAGWLERAAHLWDLQHFGQLQNQVSGYIFPMGPFFALGDLAGIPPWVTQRLWLTLLMCVAFLGVERLAGRLGIGSPGTRIAGALAYALAPRTLSIIGEISVEWLPAAMLPWILLPLLTASETGQRARGAIRSALAVALCGGVNAVAVLAVLVAPVLYILTRPRPVPRWRLLGWWSGAVAVATLFWSLPLLLIGRYAFSFLPYTETAETTTAVTSLTNVLRGASDWARYLPLNGVLEQPPGFRIATAASMVVVTGVIAALGLAGLARRDLPARGFVVTLFLVGVAALVAGHASALEPVTAEAVRWLLDGPLAPLRNLRKFDPLVRLALAFGFAHLLARHARLPVRTIAVAACTALVLPVFNQGLAAPGDFKEVPAHWREAAAWLDRNAGDDGVLVVPGAKFAEYVWGRPMDEPLQALTTARWTTRKIEPPGSVGLTRLLDAIDLRLASGRGSAGLTEVLRRLGVRYLLVRNDLVRPNLQGAWPSRVYEALRESPGITKVRSFGEPVGDQETDDAVNMLDPAFPALELYEVTGAADLVSVRPAADALAVRGAPESLLTMGELGLLDDEPVLVNGDAGTREAPTVVSDALRLKERSFGELRTNRSPTLTAGHKSDFDGVRALDLLEEGWLDEAAVAEYDGIAGISASSSAADPYAPAGISSSGRGPYAAMDGNAKTGWESDGTKDPRGEWLRVDLRGRMRIPYVNIMFAPDLLLGQAVSRVAVETEAGSLVQDVARTTDPQRLRVPDGPTSWVRIKVAATASGTWSYGQRVGVVELSIPGVTAGRTIRLPGEDGDVYVMDRGLDGRPACMRNPRRWVCNEVTLAEQSEETGFDRTFHADEAGSVTVRGTAVLRDPELIDRYTRIRADLTSVTGSSQLSEDAVVSPRSAFDGDDSTTWIPAADDKEPVLTVAWKKPITVSRVQIGRPGGDQGPLDVIVSGDGGQVRGGRVDEHGIVTFKPMKTRTLKLRFTPFAQRLQVTELIIPGVDPVGRPGDVPLRLSCGFGPAIEVNGRTIPTSVTGTHADLLEQRPVRITGCEKARLSAGDNRVRVAGWDPYAIDALVVGALPERTPGVEGGVVQKTWTPTEREVAVSAPKDSFLVVNENFNAGWRASIGGETLKPVRIDGWKQAWELPAGTTGTVMMEYLPDRVYRLALLLGLTGIALLALAAVVLRGPRPEHVRETAAAAAARLSWPRAPYVVVAALAFGGWTASWPGMLAVLGALLVTLLLRARRWPAHWAAAGACCAAALSLAAAMTLREYGIDVELLMDHVPQLASCAAVGVLFGQLVSAPARREERRELPAARQVLTGVG